MQICQNHWDELRQAIRDRGLSSFVSSSGEQAAARTKLELEDAASANTFDPLMGAHWAILDHALHAMDLRAIAMEGCPLCELIQSCMCGRGENCDYRKWIGYAADGAREEAKRLGLLKEA